MSYGAVRQLAAELDVSEVMAQVLVRRGFSDPSAAQAFLHPDYRVHNPVPWHGGRVQVMRVRCFCQRVVLPARILGVALHYKIEDTGIIGFQALGFQLFRAP